jgi:hypothetical protein
LYMYLPAIPGCDCPLLHLHPTSRHLPYPQPTLKRKRCQSGELGREALFLVSGSRRGYFASQPSTAQISLCTLSSAFTDQSAHITTHKCIPMPTTIWSEGSLSIHAHLRKITPPPSVATSASCQQTSQWLCRHTTIIPLPTTRSIKVITTTHPNDTPTSRWLRS